MNIKKEHDRLRLLLFEGAPDNCLAVCMTNHGGWFHICYVFEKIDLSVMGFKLTNKYIKCKNQPETELDWQDTLIHRSDDNVGT